MGESFQTTFVNIGCVTVAYIVKSLEACIPLLSILLINTRTVCKVRISKKTTHTPPPPPLLDHTSHPVVLILIRHCSVPIV